MKVKRHFTSIILLIISAIIMATGVFSQGNSMLPSLDDVSKLFNTLAGNSFKNWNTGPVGRNFYKVVGFAPAIKDNVSVPDLLKFMSDDADLVKIAAFNRINKMFDKSKSFEDKKELILAKIQGTIELIKYYGLKYNCPKVKFTLAQGLYYVHICHQYHKKDPGDCFKKKAMLFEAFIFTHKTEDTRLMRYWIKKTMNNAKTHLKNKDDDTIEFIETRIACELKLLHESKNIFLKAALKLYTGSNKIKDCATKLKKFESKIKQVGSFPGEYHYLLARAYSHQKKYKEAFEHLKEARTSKVLDSKTRYANKKAHDYYEKLFIRLYTN
ncbi:uncharacterized protein LOC112594720 [Melanaphis sacchari]|uniref:uncharacterized protein LOC112594720 n=1 Tax=Melanaphis sacchari TaxID=742174 RepID=UPI000DC12DC2|nr:uncharacterized protein LOC112594720 [Melanaphis sacchari]